MDGRGWFTVFMAMLMLAAFTAVSGISQGPPTNGSAKTLNCDYGLTTGLIPSPLPSNFDLYQAVAVVEINSSTAMANVSVTSFIVSDRAGQKDQMKYVVGVDVFDDPPYSARVKDVGYATYYDDVGRSHPWDGTLPKGMIRLRIRVSLAADPLALNPDGKCGIVVGPYMIEGPVTAVWPSS